MAECDVCGEEVSMPYECRHCGGTYCADHRLPESHDCPGLDNWEQSGPVFDSGFEATLDDDTGDDGLAGRLGIDTGPGGPLAYFRNNMTYVFLGLMWVTFALQLVLRPVLDQATIEAIFVFSPDNPLYVWTWITSIFAHGSPLHILFNSIVIYFFGRLVEQVIGWKKFAVLFLVSGVLAGFGQVAFNIAQGGPGVIGASGAALALMGVLTVLNPNLTVYLYFVLPLPIWVLTGGTAVVSLVFILSGSPGAGGIAHAAHFVGLAIGFLYGQRVKRSVQVPGQLQFGGGGRGGPGGPGGPGRGRI
jgi:membrane associated rhomboid family serine protease